ncbi:hypothetical protein Aca07nite_83780 [Actinoplanes capillaceus]|uniref:Uncharacterized protein n=1 Tax=Actinoplanes campanulatus TaxID=113559 RepID=A0ABQ3WXT4_9ACTN|nr:hypothetical protein [Actinoplanes capillaceus]GID51103.1 hypothetical protein Aca07nite_83780 [Actinoplanes capillaceus]
MSDASDALAWLAADGIVRAGPGTWRCDDDGSEISDSDLHFDAADWAMEDEACSPAQRVRLALGLFDLTGGIWIHEVLSRHLVTGGWDPELAEAIWAGYRARLGMPEVSRDLMISLVVNWFEDVRTSEAAFGALLGDDVRRLHGLGRLRDLPHWRAVHVLAASGPVRWEHKRDAYRACASVPELHAAVLYALVRCYHDVYGHLVPAEALELLDRLDLPRDAEHRRPLRAALAAGNAHHRDDPGLWRSES